jgi:hypothetical protein
MPDQCVPLIGKQVHVKKVRVQGSAVHDRPVYGYMMVVQPTTFRIEENAEE